MYEYSYMMDEELGAAVGIVTLLSQLLSIGISIVAYILSSVGLHTIAKRRGITNPWLAWIPVVNAWIVGSISDQYRYITKGQIKNKRKILLVLNIVAVLVSVAVIVIAGMTGAELMMMGTAITDAELVSAMAAFLLRIVGLVLMLGVVSIVRAVVHYMAMYDLYTSVNPPCNVMFLVLSIVFGITEPFFVFFNRKKDGGMPPRCDIPVAPVQAETQILPPQPPIQELLEETTEEEPNAE